MGTKELSELSPGERGTLLLVFYLLVDKDDIPLMIDQPEENLDNQTVFDLLVPCIKGCAAKATDHHRYTQSQPRCGVRCGSGHSCRPRQGGQLPHVIRDARLSAKPCWLDEQFGPAERCDARPRSIPLFLI
jgi:hypothetical protein